MKNWKQRTFGSGVFFGMVAIIVLGFGFVGCKPEPDPDPVERDKTVTLTAEKTVTVYFTAPPNVTPIWWDTLESVLKNRAPGFTGGDHTLTVIYEGSAGFNIGDDGKATVSEAFLIANASYDPGYNVMRASLTTVIVNEWIAMIGPNVHAG